LSFAVCPQEEEEDYFACLNFFREAQQNELKEHPNYGMFAQKVSRKHICLSLTNKHSRTIRFIYLHTVSICRRSLG
jgi:hypothetical protein